MWKAAHPPLPGHGTGRLRHGRTARQRADERPFPPWRRGALFRTPAVGIRPIPRTESLPALPEKAAKLPLVLIHTPNCYLRHIVAAPCGWRCGCLLPKQSASNAVRL